MTFNVFLCLISLAVLVAIAVIDLQKMEIPYSLNAALAIIGLVRIAVLDLAWREAVIGMFVLAGPMVLANVLAEVLAKVLAREPKMLFGGGDILMLAAAGFLLGWKSLLWAGVIAYIGAGALAAVLLVMRRTKKDAYLPMGPFLAAGIGIELIFVYELV